MSPRVWSRLIVVLSVAMQESNPADLHWCATFWQCSVALLWTCVEKVFACSFSVMTCCCTNNHFTGSIFKLCLQLLLTRSLNQEDSLCHRGMKNDWKRISAELRPELCRYQCLRVGLLCTPLIQATSRPVFKHFLARNYKSVRGSLEKVHAARVRERKVE